MTDLQFNRDPIHPQQSTNPLTAQDPMNPVNNRINESMVKFDPHPAPLDESDRDRRSMVDASEPPTKGETIRDRDETDDRAPLALRQGASEPVANDVTPLFSEFEVNDLRSRWSDVQAGFVDSPQRSVQQADELVAAVMQRLANGFAEERSSLERQWDRGDNVSTEDLRVALQRYRSFFGRLLNAA